MPENILAKNYNSFPEAAEALVSKNGTAHLIRKRQTLDQIVQNEITPSFFKSTSHSLNGGWHDHGWLRWPSRLDLLSCRLPLPSSARRRLSLGRRRRAGLDQQGCMKINFQIMAGNENVASFYSSLGFSVEKRVSMAKQILENVSAS